MGWARRLELASLLLASLAAVVSLLYSNSQIRDELALNREQLRTAQEGLITDRYTAAVTNLGDESISVRLGGVYALKLLMQDSPSNQPIIAEILAAHIRAAPRTGNEAIEDDVQAALTALGNRDRQYDGDDFHLNLSKLQLSDAVLNGADLTDAWLEHADLTDARLDGANLTRARLERANLTDALLGSADLTYTSLAGANLTRAYLEGADLTGVHLGSADLTRAYLNGADLTKASMEDADLTGAELNDADLTGAQLKRANLTGASLEGANLTNAEVTVEQLSTASISSKTILPAGYEDVPAIQELIAESRNDF